LFSSSDARTAALVVMGRNDEELLQEVKRDGATDAACITTAIHSKKAVCSIVLYWVMMTANWSLGYR